MADEVRKGVKRPTLERDDQSSNEEVHCEEAINKFEQLEAKRWRSYSDFCNSDTGATVRFCFRFSFLMGNPTCFNFTSRWEILTLDLLFYR